MQSPRLRSLGVPRVPKFRLAPIGLTQGINRATTLVTLVWPGVTHTPRSNQIVLDEVKVTQWVVLWLLLASKRSIPLWSHIRLEELLCGLKLDCQRKKKWYTLPMTVPLVDLSAASPAADPIGQPQTEMPGEPWCNFLQRLLMRFAWCSPM